MADFRIGRLKFKWRGDWQTATQYLIDDIVKYGGNTYVAIENHTSSSTVADFYTDSAKWSLHTEGLFFKGDWIGGTFYKQNDVVKYGANQHRCTVEHTATTSFDNTKFELLLEGLQFEDSWNSAVQYQLGDIVTYGGYSYVAARDNVNVTPYGNTSDWELLSTGFNAKGAYIGGFAYKVGDVIQYGGYSYVCIQDTSSAQPTDTGYWTLLNTGFSWEGTWDSNINYRLGDIVEYSASSYICVSPHVAVTPGTDNTKWQMFAQGDANAVMIAQGDIIFRDATDVTRLPAGADGTPLITKGPAADPQWGHETLNTVYVSVNGDDTNSGKSAHDAVRTIKRACVLAAQDPGYTTVQVESGTYEEQLPIYIPSGTKLFGAGIRQCTVSPAAGLSDDGITPNNETVMFYVNDATTIQGFSMTGMTGFTPDISQPQNLELATIKGVFVCFDPNGEILHRSPYIKDCSTFSEGGVGVIVDGEVHNSGNKSMVFHAFTNLNSNGVGFWVRYGGRAEIVSSFTYYCHVGYSCTTGGTIRSLSGNNSYGTYGAVSNGTFPLENTVNGVVDGKMIEYVDDGVHQAYFSNSETITGSVSGATATIIYGVQGKFRYIIDNIVDGPGGPFQAGEIITGAISGSQATLQTNPVLGQKGFVMHFTGFPEEPRPGGSVAFLPTGGGSGTDAFTYIIGSVAEWNSVTGNAILTFNQEKLSEAVEGQTAAIRYLYSNIRLTGHDFLNVGTGGTATTNYPGDPLQDPSQGNEVVENFPGRVYYISTDQNGNFRVGNYFKIDQATGRATLNADAFDLSGLTELRLGAIGAQLGESINEFSSDQFLAGDSNEAVPTEQAIVGHLTRGYSGTGAWRLPAGTTAERPASAVAGMLRYNTQTNVHEQYNGTIWVSLDNPPVITSVSPLSADPNIARTITIVGDRFRSGDKVYVGGALISPSDVTIVDGQRLQFNTGNASNLASLTAGVYDITVEGPSGLRAVKEQAFTINFTPIWQTAQSFGTIDEGSTESTVLVATDPEGDDVDYVVVADTQGLFVAAGGTLTLVEETGQMGGTWPAVAADTVYNFTIRATDNAPEPNSIDRVFTVTVRNNTAPTITSPTTNQTFGDFGTTVEPSNPFSPISASATDNEGHGLTWSVAADSTGVFSNGLSINSTTGEITGTVNHGWLNRAYSRSAPVTLRVTDNGPIPQSSDVPININFATTWRYRTIINRGYMMGGYRSSAPWNNINQTIHSTDTTTNLGDIMTYQAAYHDGGFSDTVGMSWGVDNSYPGTTANGQSFNMTNNTSRGASSSWNMSVSRNDLGCVNDDVNNYAYMTGGGSEATDRFNFTTDTRDTTIGNSGLSADYVGAADGGTHGYFWNGTHRKLTFSNTTFTGMFATRGTHSKGLTSKWGFFYMGPPNDTQDMLKVNTTTDTALGTLGQYPGVDSQGEHNFEMGQDVGYSIGMWQGDFSQANDSWKLYYSTDTFDQGVNGHATLQPKGHDGCSSGACYSTGI